MTELQVLEKLADGVAAEMFLARQRGAQAPVVVEVARPELLTNAAQLSRFLEELDRRKGWTHPNLVRRVSKGRTRHGRPYVVTETLPELSLRALLSTHGTLSPEQALQILLPLCDAVGFVHAQGSAHGNLCPENVRVSWVGDSLSPKLLDSGLVLLRAGLAPSPQTVLVRPEYLSPERVAGTRATPLSDVYALGILLFEMLTGRPPFTSADLLTTRRKHLAEPTPELPDHLRFLRRVLSRCLSKDPAERYASARALRAALQWLAAEPSGSSGSSGSSGLGASPSASPSASSLLSSSATSSNAASGSQASGQAASVAPSAGQRRPAEVAQHQTLGPYELEGLLGEGAMGQVFAARHSRLGRRVAIKILRADQAQNRNLVERFLQEARAVNLINHEHIVQIYDFVEDVAPSGRARVYCVMELLEGVTLQKRLKDAPLPLRQLVSVARQVCAALGAAHKVSVIHRDVKPDNLFLVPKSSGELNVKVLDFGIAKLRSEDRTELTRHGEILGTPAYMAPEQVTGKPADARTDIYALGNVLYRALSGVLPFQGMNFAEHLMAHVTRMPPQLPPHAVSGEPLPAALAAAVFKCLAKDPAARPQSMEELSELLAPFELPSAAPLPLPPPPPSAKVLPAPGPATPRAPPNAGLELDGRPDDPTPIQSGFIIESGPPPLPSPPAPSPSPSPLIEARLQRTPRPPPPPPVSSPRPAAVPAASHPHDAQALTKVMSFAVVLVLLALVFMLVR